MNNENNEPGLLEYFNTSTWVPVCFTGAFDEYAADVTCRQLGYPFATNFSSVELSYYRSGIGITRSLCERANSSYLFNCVQSISVTCHMQVQLTCYNSKCTYLLKCVAIYNEWNIILGSNTVHLIGSPVEYMGRVEVFDRTSNQWGTICYNDVSSYQYYLANIICKSLGYYSYYNYGQAINFPNIELSSHSPIVNGSIRCTYPSSSSLSYVYQNVYQCSDFESKLGINISRCTSDQEWIVMCSRKLQ